MLELKGTFGSVRSTIRLGMCNGPEGKTDVLGRLVWRWTLGNLATALLEETPHTLGTT